MGKQLSSVDIQALDYNVLFDISTPVPAVTLSNASTQSAPNNLKWAFEIYSPSGTPIHQGNFTTPDVNGNWNANFVKNTGFPKFGGIIEIGTYRIVVKVKDASGAIYELEKNVQICRPAGNSKDSTTLYGLCVHEIKTKCQTNQLSAEDKSSYSYNGKLGTAVTKTFKLLYPPDDTGTPTTTFDITNFQVALMPIGVPGEGYQAFQSSIFTYDFGDLVTVKVKYIGRSTFPVHCNFNPGPLLCEMKKLIDSVENGTCDNKAEANDKLNKINPKFNLMLMGILFPQTCADPWALADEIKAIGGFDCDCCITAGGGGANGVLIDDLGLSFLVTTGGDITASWGINGSNVTLTIQDYSYVFRMSPGYGGNAFTVEEDTTGRTITYNLLVDESILADEILTLIESNTEFINRLVSLVTVNSGNVTIDPKCLSAKLGVASNACDYVFTLIKNPGNGMMISILQREDQDPVQVNKVFDGTNAAAIQTYLNTLGVGAFTVAYNSGTSTLTITTLANTNKFKGFVYASGVSIKVSTTAKSNCTGTFSFTNSAVMQALVDVYCELSGNALKAGCPVNIKRLVKVAGDIQTVTAGGDETFCMLFNKLIESYNKLVDIVQAIKEVNCENLQEVFSNDAAALEGTTRLYGKVNGECFGIPLDLLMQKLLGLTKTSQVLKDLFCELANSCGKSVCEAVINAVASYNAGTGVLSVVIDNPTGSTTFKVGYIIHTVTGRGQVLGVKEVARTAGATTTITWNGVPAGTWDVIIQNKCGVNDFSSEYMASTAACDIPGTFNVIQDGTNFVATWGSIPGGAAKVRLEIEYPNGGQTATKLSGWSNATYNSDSFRNCRRCQVLSAYSV
jgi:hypothetical protein